MAKKKKTKIVTNSYEKVLADLNISPEQLFESGMKYIKCIDRKSIDEKWKMLICDVKDCKSNNEVFVRSHGRNGGGSKQMQKILNYVFGRSFTIDSSNNSVPKRILGNAFETEEYQDYQISHLFEERTNNPLLFSAPWMICYTPKIIDPFTGHETKGFPQFQAKFIDWAFDNNEKYINEYNKIILPYWKKLKSLPDFKDTKKYDIFHKHMITTLAPIYKDAEIGTKSERTKYYLKKFSDL